jgi:hypothetical protein
VPRTSNVSLPAGQLARPLDPVARAVAEGARDQRLDELRRRAEPFDGDELPDAIRVEPGVHQGHGASERVSDQCDRRLDQHLEHL